MDQATLHFYRGHAEAYAGREITSRKARLAAFLALLPPGGRILELGCGAGGDTAEMLAQGFNVRATDGSPEMADVASKRLGRTVETLLFHEVDEVEAYDAVWANACLLHVPRDELADILALIRRALLELSVRGLAACNLCRRRRMEFAVGRERRGQRLRRQDGTDAVRRGAEGRAEGRVKNGYQLRDVAVYGRSSTRAGDGRRMWRSRYSFRRRIR